MDILFTLVFELLLVAVSAQQPIVSQLQYSSGDTFNITCDASRFSGLKAANYFMSMSLWRQVSPQAAFINIASYEPRAEFNTTTNAPSQWQVNFSGGEGFTNRNIMKIIVTVVNYQCTDAGLYKCQAVMPSPSTTYETTPVNLTAKVGITQNNISMAPHNQADGTDENSSVNSVGEEISMTCTFTGPANLQAVWKRNDEDYPYQNNITNSNPSSSSASGCNIYAYSSELKFTLEESDSGNTYICVVMEGNNERSRKMFTIEVKSTPDDNGNPGSNTAGAEINVGAIVGGVIGGVVFLVIVVVLIYFFVIRKRMDKNDDDSHRKNVEATDNGKDNLSPPPVFYSKPHKPPKDDSDGSSWRGEVSQPSGTDPGRNLPRSHGNNNPTFCNDIHYASVDVSPPPIPIKDYKIDDQNLQLHYLDLSLPKKQDGHKKRMQETVIYSEVNV